MYYQKQISALDKLSDSLQAMLEQFIELNSLLEDVENTLDNFNDQLDDINTNLTLIEGKLTNVKTK